MQKDHRTEQAAGKYKLTKILASAAFVLVVPLSVSATEYRTIDHPRQECWNEQAAQPGNGGIGGAILGGITGGLLGNQVGRGNGQIAATAVGAATGAVVGDRISGNAGYGTVQRCRTVIDQERIAIEPVRRYYYQRDDEDRDAHYRKHHHRKHRDEDDDDD